MPGRRERKALENPQLFTAYAKAAAFPRDLLHPTIAERVWAALARGGRGVLFFSAWARNGWPTPRLAPQAPAIAQKATLGDIRPRY